MMKPKKRLSAGMGFSADGIDPQFEFDVPRLFVDLTLPPKYARRASAESPLLAHDAWFDLVHDDHSRPSEEFLAQQEAEQSHAASSSSSSSSSAVGAGSASLRPLQHHHQANADGEKENAGGGARLRRRNVAYSGKSDAASGGAAKTAIRATGATVSTIGAKKKLPFGNSTTPATKSVATASAQTLPRKRSVAEKTMSSTSSSVSRSRTLPVAASSSTAAASKDLHDLQALLAKHNKKFKTSHSYEPRQHSVRDVRQWERQTQKSYYKLSSDDRTKANAEIALLVQARDL